ncbi:hypothetical protein RA2_00851 [Roseovarius sp. A-2]|uniref:hypothetical protein n=1 Tax=Roseovarius sp. A-2 TaxID=1570360 RepID=UPI0009CCBFB9|nr:hypothetical protein [Roseovarius sp. A-2]GAW33806.1 hypothetical protein RA2_00851 [Roseovarius sp. A-2]
MLVLFHTVFNLFGVAIFLPLSARTDALRWLGRVADHAARLSGYAEKAKRID